MFFSRSDITIVCKAMEFALYPLDNHKCYLILTSCKFCTACINVHWSPSTAAQSCTKHQCFALHCSDLNYFKIIKLEVGGK